MSPSRLTIPTICLTHPYLFLVPFLKGDLGLPKGENFGLSVRLFFYSAIRPIVKRILEQEVYVAIPFPSH